MFRKSRLSKLDCTFLVLLIFLNWSASQLTHGFPQLSSREIFASSSAVQSSDDFTDSFKELLEVETADVIATVLPAPTSLAQSQSPLSSDDDYGQSTTTFEQGEQPAEDQHESTPISEIVEPTQPVPENNEGHQEKEGQKVEDETQGDLQASQAPEQPEKVDSAKDSQDAVAEPKREREREEELYTNHNVQASVEVERKEALNSDSDAEKTEKIQVPEIAEVQSAPVENSENLESSPTRLSKNNETSGELIEGSELDQLEQPESSDPPLLAVSVSREEVEEEEEPAAATITIKEINIFNNSSESQDERSSSSNDISKNDNDNDSSPQLSDTLINNNSTSNSNTDAELVSLDAYLKHGATYYIQNVQDAICLTARKHKFLETGKGFILGKVTTEEFLREDGQIFDAFLTTAAEDGGDKTNAEFWLSSLKYNINEVSMTMSNNGSPIRNSMQIIIPTDSITPNSFLIKSKILDKCIQNQGKHQGIVYATCDDSIPSQQWIAKFLYEDVKAKL